MSVTNKLNLKLELERLRTRHNCVSIQVWCTVWNRSSAFSHSTFVGLGYRKGVWVLQNALCFWTLFWSFWLDGNKWVTSDSDDERAGHGLKWTNLSGAAVRIRMPGGRRFFIVTILRNWSVITSNSRVEKTETKNKIRTTTRPGFVMGRNLRRAKVTLMAWTTLTTLSWRSVFYF